MHRHTDTTAHDNTIPQADVRFGVTELGGRSAQIMHSVVLHEFPLEKPDRLTALDNVLLISQSNKRHDITASTHRAAHTAEQDGSCIRRRLNFIKSHVNETDHVPVNCIERLLTIQLKDPHGSIAQKLHGRIRLMQQVFGRMRQICRHSSPLSICHMPHNQIYARRCTR